jgi:hypothetical protein
MKIDFPPKTPGGQIVEFEPGCRVVLVGANGSGKTRFGIWLEEKNQGHMTVHRISAQKVLNLPEYAPAKSVAQAEKDLLFGRSDEHASLARKVHDRWGGHPATFLLTDYEKLLGLLFAKNAQRDRLHTEQTRSTGKYNPVADSPIDAIVKVWGDLMPHRTVSCFDGKVMVGKGTATEYHAMEMSDGERVALYLLGQCLCVPPDSMLIIDEPELHLHKSILDKLWNKVEELCPKLTIVYITHDLDFAASRAGAKKIWAQSYSGKDWTWSDIPADESLPEALILEIVGNRKRLLFCEGDRGGLDHLLYQLCYPERHVVPRGGAEKVIEATKALHTNTDLHSFAAEGIVDRDMRSDEEIAALESQGVQSLEFAEIENVLCTENLVAQVASQLSLNAPEVVASVTKFVSDALESEMEAQIVKRAERRIRHHLSMYAASSSDEPGLQQGVTALVSNLDIARIVSESREAFAGALASSRLNDILRVYNRKSLANRISTCFGLKHAEYPALVVRLLKGDQRERYVGAIVGVLPKLGGA